MPYWEREWYRRRSGGDGSDNLMNRSFRIFRVAGIAVDVHILFVIFIAVELLQGALDARGGGLWWKFQTMSVLWVSVLLHEFGHCFGARWTGGSADRILMWPLGGLAYVRAPDRPGAQLITTAAGPAVNLALMALSAGALLILHGDWELIPLHPLNPFGTAGLALSLFGEHSLEWWLLVVYGINYSLFVFNVFLPIFPLDGGRMLQEILWFRMGHFRSMMRSLAVGMFGAICLGVFGLVSSNWMLLGIAVFCYMECLQVQQFLAAHPPEPWQESLDMSPEPAPVRTAPSKAWFWERSAAEREAKEDAMVDEILDKIHKQGLNSLSEYEKRVLKNATERQKRK